MKHYELNKNLKKSIDLFFEYCELLDKIVPTGGSSTNWRSFMKYNLLEYFYSLMSIDGNVSKEELDLLCFYLDHNYTEAELADISSKLGHDYTKEAPLILKSIVIADNKSKTMGEGTTLCKTFVGLVKDLGIEMAFADGNVSEDEKNILVESICTMNKYIAENLI